MNIQAFSRTVSSKELLDIQETIEYGYTLKRKRDKTYNQMHRTDKYS